ncbi:MAG: glycosyltransferase [Flavobacteriaceae bacterium]|jgi:GT2 family glycosyltransferase|nr:glycosyltransferase [Flavobacteriaceae bacterium]
MHGDFVLKLSIIIAVYNRRDELQELLDSLVYQTDKNFEVIIVDDGSKEKLEFAAENYHGKLDLKYFYKFNSGAGLARNYGSRRASGSYFLFLDSDCIVPPDYIQNVRKELKTNYVDAFGGADSAHVSFNDMQKAISYSMTSLFTTGGIRGNKKAVARFQPRSFNMGISKEAFEAVGGFSEMRIGEDPDLSLTLWEKGFQTRFFSDCKVFHKRRTSLRKFSNQVYHFGIARPILNQRHPVYTKITFWFPTLFIFFTVFALLSILCYLFIPKNTILYDSLYGEFYKYSQDNRAYIAREFSLLPFVFLVLYGLIIFFDSTLKNKSLKVGFLSLIAVFVQFFSYGFGFLQSFTALNILRQKPEKIFPSHYYKSSERGN